MQPITTHSRPSFALLRRLTLGLVLLAVTVAIATESAQAQDDRAPDGDQVTVLLEEVQSLLGRDRLDLFGNHRNLDDVSPDVRRRVAAEFDMTPDWLAMNMKVNDDAVWEEFKAKLAAIAEAQGVMITMKPLEVSANDLLAGSELARSVSSNDMMALVDLKQRAKEQRQGLARRVNQENVTYEILRARQLMLEEAVDSGGLNGSDFEERMRKLDAQKEELDEQIARLTAEIDVIESVIGLVERVGQQAEFEPFDVGMAIEIRSGMYRRTDVDVENAALVSTIASLLRKAGVKFALPAGDMQGMNVTATMENVRIIDACRSMLDVHAFNFGMDSSQRIPDILLESDGLLSRLVLNEDPGMYTLNSNAASSELEMLNAVRILAEDVSNSSWQATYNYPRHELNR